MGSQETDEKMLLHQRTDDRSRRRTAPQRQRKQTLAIVALTLGIGLCGHIGGVYALTSHKAPSKAVPVIATEVTSPSDASPAAWAPMGSLRFNDSHGAVHLVTTYVDPQAKDGQTQTVWIAPDGTLTGQPTRVSPWAVSLGTGFWAAAVAAAVLTVASFVTRFLASIREQELFDAIVSPIRADAARWLRDWD